MVFAGISRNGSPVTSAGRRCRAVVTQEQFDSALGTFRPSPDDDQRRVMEPDASRPLFIVAGPGTGKTTSLTLRILKLVFVDDVAPRSIVATTFTKKAAEELRSRVLGWGFRLTDAFVADESIAVDVRREVEGLDINQVWTGTIDSLCDDLLRRYRPPGTQPPILVDEFVSNTLMLRAGLFDQRRYEDPALDTALLPLHSGTGNTFGYYIGRKATLLHDLWERRYHDIVDWAELLRQIPAAEMAGWRCVDEALSAYGAELTERMSVDFCLLENEVLGRLRKGLLEQFTRDVRVVLVDEYQDTNLLQEQLYFELAAACDGALTVVGDDDQSLFRFRGATVDLFRDFPERYEARFGFRPKPVFLTWNYRSSEAIIRFVNNYATLDTEYQTVRVAGKPRLRPGPNASEGIPVLGLFRPTPAEIAADLAIFVGQVFRGRGAKVGNQRIRVDPKAGDVGDCVLLCSSPAEYGMAIGAKPPKERLPLLLRRALATQSPSIGVFNPRGEDLSAIPIITRFGGLLLECLDPGGEVQPTIKGLSYDTIQTMDRWRDAAIDFVGSAAAPDGLLEYCSGWVERDPRRGDVRWPRSVPIIDLVYGLVHFFPELHDDAEGQIYLEVFTRQLAACTEVGRFRGEMVRDRDKPHLEAKSVQEVLRDFLAPIAAGIVKVNEELLEAFPRDRLSILSIHQAKGLEFPLTIVDVGSDFTGNYAASAFKRFPTDGAVTHRLEDAVRVASPLGLTERSQTDRAFDDLYRQYFVAFSRPVDVLLLVGATRGGPGGNVKNVAAGWDRNELPRWAGEECPITRI